MVLVYVALSNFCVSNASPIRSCLTAFSFRSLKLDMAAIITLDQKQNKLLENIEALLFPFIVAGSGVEPDLEDYAPSCVTTRVGLYHHPGFNREFGV